MIFFSLHLGCWQMRGNILHKVDRVSININISSKVWKKTHNWKFFHSQISGCTQILQKKQK